MSSTIFVTQTQPQHVIQTTTTTTPINTNNLIQSIFNFTPPTTLLNNNNTVFRISQNYPSLKKNKKIIRRIVEYYFVKIREYYLQIGSVSSRFLALVEIAQKWKKAEGSLICRDELTIFEILEQIVPKEKHELLLNKFHKNRFLKVAHEPFGSRLLSEIS